MLNAKDHQKAVQEELSAASTLSAQTTQIAKILTKNMNANVNLVLREKMAEYAREVS